VPEDSDDQIGTLWEMPVQRAKTDAGPLGDIAYGGVHSRCCKHRFRCQQQRVQTAPCIGANGTIPFTVVPAIVAGTCQFIHHYISACKMEH